MTRVQTNSAIEPIEIRTHAAEAPNLSQGWQRPSVGDNDFQQLANALSALSPSLTNYANKAERIQQQEQLAKAQMEFSKARMDGTMEPLRKAVREGKLPEGDNPWLNVFRKKLVVANDINEVYREGLIRKSALLADPDTQPEAIQQAYNEAKSSIQPLLDSTDPVIQGELIGRLQEANNDFEAALANNRSKAMVDKTMFQANSLIGSFIDSAVDGGTINRTLFNNQMSGLLKQAKSMGVMDTNAMFVDAVTSKAKTLASTNPDAAISLIEAAREYSPVPGATIGSIPKYSEQLDQIQLRIDQESVEKMRNAAETYKRNAFQLIDESMLEHKNDSAALEQIASDFEQQAIKDGFNSVSFDIRDHIAKRAGQISQALQYVDNPAIADIQRLAYVGEIEEAQTRLNAANNIPFDTRIQLSKLIQSQQKTIDNDHLDNFKKVISDTMYAPGNIDPSLFPAPDPTTHTSDISVDVEQKQESILQGVSKLRTKLVNQFAAANNMSVAQTLGDVDAMAEIDAKANEFIAQSTNEYATKLNLRNRQKREQQERQNEIQRAELPWRLTEYFRNTDSNLRNLDAVRLRLLSKPSTAHTPDADAVRGRWVDAVANANSELDRLAGSMLNGMQPESGSSDEALSNEEMTRRINEVSLKTYHKLHDAIGWSLAEIQKGYSRHGVTFKDEDINPLVTRIVDNPKEFNTLKSSEELIKLSRRFNLPPEVLVAAQADLLGLTTVE